MKKAVVQNCKGILLIEVMAASVLVAFSSVLFYAMYWSSLNRMEDARSETLAASTAFAIIESLRDSDQKIPLEQAGRFSIPSDIDTGVFIPAGMRAFLETQPLLERTHLVRLRVRLEWNGVKETRSLDMVTLVRKYSD